VKTADVATLVHRAADGEAQAWGELVEQFSALVWSIARGYGLDSADAADVSQTSWLRLAENLHRLNDPDHVGAWLATTARREALRVVRRGQRLIPSGVDFDSRISPESAQPEEPILRRERREAISSAFRRLPALCQTLLRMLMVDPAPSYTEVSEVLEMPIGSIGPRRARCLDRLRLAVESQDDGARAVEVASR
jgi:RNA polymerase sigma factor (sigma-70 family)